MARLILEQAPDGSDTGLDTAHVCESFDAAGACTAWVQVEVQERPMVGGSVVPPLPVEDAATILAGALLVWTCAWGFRQLLRLMWGN